MEIVCRLVGLDVAVFFDGVAVGEFGKILPVDDGVGVEVGKNDVLVGDFVRVEIVLEFVCGPRGVGGFSWYLVGQILWMDSRNKSEKFVAEFFFHGGCVFFCIDFIAFFTGKNEDDFF